MGDCPRLPNLLNRLLAGTGYHIPVPDSELASFLMQSENALVGLGRRACRTPPRRSRHSGPTRYCHFQARQIDLPVSDTAWQGGGLQRVGSGGGERISPYLPLQHSLSSNATGSRPRELNDPQRFRCGGIAPSLEEASSLRSRRHRPFAREKPRNARGWIMSGVAQSQQAGNVTAPLATDHREGRGRLGSRPQSSPWRRTGRPGDWCPYRPHSAPPNPRHWWGHARASRRTGRPGPPKATSDGGREDPRRFRGS
jgi:hypothetical protein